MFLLDNLHGKNMLVFTEVDVLMILTENWPFDNVLFVGVFWRAQFPCGRLIMKKLIKRYKVGHRFTNK